MIGSRTTADANWSDGAFLLDTLIWMANAFRSYAIPLQIFVTSEPELYQQANLQHPLFLDNALTLHLPRFESWTIDTLSPSQSIFKNYGQKIYQCATHMRMSEHPLLRECIQADEDAITGVLEGVLNSEIDTQDILALRDDSAHSFLNLLQIGQLSTHEVGRKARRLLVKLSERSEIIPASVLIRGLTLTDTQPVSGGGFADIYLAMYRGQEVAVKHLRVRQDQDSQRIRRLLEVAEGLEYLHSEGVIHGDLRGVDINLQKLCRTSNDETFYKANILASNDWHAVLSDFGLTVFGDATVATHSSNPQGSVRWMAPELLNPEIFDMERFIKTQASDVYAFACVCLELYTGHHPFVEAANDAAGIYRVMMGQRPSLRSPVSADETDFAMPDHVVEVVEWCWKHRPQERPEITDVVEIMKTWDSMMIE
ncbi:hypothetical protein C0995_015261 [Termitomyces sp. Mi166|nr:hypothetical protein C0995_015261 [Termitomyces sp. Mi166\